MRLMLRRSRQLLKRRLGALKDEGGWSLIEMMAALLVFAITAVMIAGTLTKAAQWTRDVRMRTTAAHLAQQDISIIKSTPFSSISRDTTTATREVDGHSYSVQRAAALVPRHSVGSPCASAGGDSTNYLRITIKVTWNVMGTTKAIENNTVVAPKPGDLDPTNGQVGVKVVDGNGNPVSGSRIDAAVGNSVGIASISKTTDSNGCAFFDSLSPNSYTFWITDPEFVDPSGKAGSENHSSTSVLATQTSFLEFTVARQATLSVTPANFVDYPLVGEAQLVLYSTAFANATQTRTVAGTVWPRNVTTLFPSPSGYVLWSGSCADADPGADRPPAAAAVSGQTSSVAVAAGRFQANLNSGGSPGTLLLTATHASDAGCAAGETYTFSPTVSEPNTVKASLPYGAWSLSLTADGVPVGSAAALALAATDVDPIQVAVGAP